MNCKQAQKNILLQLSGELKDSEQHKLTIHIGKCRKCAAYRDISINIMRISAQAMPDGPNSATIKTIMDNAAVPPARILIFRRHLIQWSAAAALILIMLGVWSIIFTPQKSTADKISDMYAIMLVTLDDYPENSESSGTTGIPDMESLLKKLEIPDEDTYPNQEESSEPQTIYPQSYNTRGSPQRIYG